MIKLKGPRLDALWNVAPKNKTQTAFTRFQKQPYGALRSAFTDSQEAFKLSNPMKRTEIETPFSDILGPLVLGDDDGQDGGRDD